MNKVWTAAKIEEWELRRNSLNERFKTLGVLDIKLKKKEVKKDGKQKN